MLHLYGKAERCQTLPSLLENVLFSVYKGKLFSLGTLVNVFNTAVLGDHDLKKRLYLQGQRWTDILECLGSILVAINMHIILFPLVLRRPRLTLKMNTYMIFK